MRAVLDACVLYPTILREILGDCAAAGLFRPVWSQRILDEWRLAADRNGLPAGPEIALLTDRFPEAMAVPAGGADGADAAGRRPARHRLRIDAEHEGDLTRGE